MSEDQAMMNPEFVHQLKWYYWPLCPLLPDWRYRPGDSQNCWDFHVHWLVFRLWTKMTPDIGFEFELGQQIQIRVNLPFLHTGIFIPLMPWQFHYKFWRVPKRGTGEGTSE